MAKRIAVVCGAGGFIGGHLVAPSARRARTDVRAVDIKPLRRVVSSLRRRRQSRARSAAGASRASRRPQGARGHLQPGRRHGRHGLHREQQGPVHAQRADQHAPAAWRPARPASSGSSTPRRACVYTADKQTRSRRRRRCKEDDAYPAMPEDGYGWEKLFSERMCRHFREDFGLDDARRPVPQRLRPARHLGRRPREGAGGDLPQGDRGQAESGEHEIEIWGDGEQTRSFMYIDDCVEGIAAIMAATSSSRSTSAATSW